MFCAILVHISATDDSLTGERGEDQNSDRVSADGAETGEKQSLLHRGRRAIKKNSTPSLSEIEKRLKAMEERLERYVRVCIFVAYEFKTVPLKRIPYEITTKTFKSQIEYESFK